jgi:hypothetical protein
MIGELDIPGDPIRPTVQRISLPEAHAVSFDFCRHHISMHIFKRECPNTSSIQTPE